MAPYDGQPCINCNKNNHHLQKCTALEDRPPYRLTGCPTCNTLDHNFGDRGCDDPDKKDPHHQWKYLILYRNNTFPLDSPIRLRALRQLNEDKGKSSDFGPWTQAECQANRDQIGRAPWGDKRSRPSQNEDRKGGQSRSKPSSEFEFGNDRASSSSMPFTFEFSGGEKIHIPPNADPKNFSKIIATFKNAMGYEAPVKTQKRTAEDIPVDSSNARKKKKRRESRSLVATNNDTEVKQLHTENLEQRDHVPDPTNTVYRLEENLGFANSANTDLKPENLNLKKLVAKISTLPALRSDAAMKYGFSKAVIHRKEFNAADIFALNQLVAEFVRAGEHSEGSVFDTQLPKNLEEFASILEKPVVGMTDLIEIGACEWCNVDEAQHDETKCFCFCGNPGREHKKDMPCPEVCFCHPQSRHCVADHWEKCIHAHRKGAIAHAAALCDLCHCCGEKHATDACPILVLGRTRTCICGAMHLYGACPELCITCGNRHCREHCFFCGRSNHRSSQCIRLGVVDGVSHHRCIHCRVNHSALEACSCTDEQGNSKGALWKSVHNPMNRLTNTADVEMTG